MTYITSSEPTDVIDVNKGTLTIKLESEDIIELQPSENNSDDKQGLVEPVTHEKHPKDNREYRDTLNESAKDSVNVQNVSTMPLSFQESRTPFSKRLKMLSRGISTRSLNQKELDVEGKLKMNLTRPHQVNEDKSVSLEDTKALNNKESITEKDKDGAKESEKYSGKRLFIAEDNDSDQDSNPNKNKRSKNSEDGNLNYPSFMPIIPIPTILNQTSDEEKSKLKLTKCSRPIRSTRQKRKVTK